MVNRHHVRRTRLAGLVLAVIIAAVPAAARAQKQEEGSNWGVSVSFVPTWKTHDQWKKIFITEAPGSTEGSEFSFGLARGKAHGGHWTVSYIQKPYKEGTTVTLVEEFSDGGFFSRTTETTTYHDVRYTGIEATKYFAFATIKRRVQIGMTVGGGIANVKGTITEVEDQFNRSTAPNGQVFTNTDHFEETLPANEVLFKYQPLFKAEVQGGVILAPGAKVTIAWGFNAPGTGLRIGGVYLFGAK